MKPINPQLGASTLRISRIADLDIESKSWDSVIFQQGKSLLDFDLNVMQRILRENVSQISRTIYSSGFLTQSSCDIINTTTVRLYDSRVNFFGTIARIANPDTSASGSLYVDITCSDLTGIAAVSSQAFLWIELWFQEVVPASTAEKIDGSSTSVESKSALVPKYGGELNTGITNEMFDTNFGAETTRRVQVRWRIRRTVSSAFTSTAVSSTSPVLKGFESPDGTSATAAVYAQGGRQTCSFTGYISNGTSGQAGNVLTISNVTSGYIPANNVMTITGNGVTPVTVTALLSGASGIAGSTYSLSGSSQSAGTSVAPIAISGWFTPTKTFRRADRQITSIGPDFYVDRDTRVFIAGDGSATDAVALNTVDGRVYGIPIGFYYHNGTTGVFSNKRDTITTTSGVAIDNTQPATIGDTNRVSIGGTPGTNAFVGASSSNTDASLEIRAQGSGDVIIGSNPNTSTQLVSNYIGDIGSPTYSWVSDSTTGIYRSGAGLIDFSSAGTKVAELGTSLASSLTVNTTYSSGGALSAIAVNAGGSGYAVGDIVTIAGGSTSATAIVTSVSNGVVQSGGLSIVSAGSGYTASGTGTGIATSITQKSLDLIGYGKFSRGIGVSGSLALTTTSGKLSLSGLDASSLAASSLSLTTTGAMNFSIGAATKWTLPSSASALTFGTSSGSSSQLLTLNTLNSRVSIVTTGYGATFTTAASVTTITSGGSITAAGTGYAVGDILTVGSSGGRISVTTINASGGITGFAVNNAGSSYSASTGYSTSYYVSVSANTLALDASGIIKGSIFSATGDPAGAGATFTIASGATTLTTGGAIANAGAGYRVGDILTVAGGSTLGKITVGTISASGGILTFSVVSGSAGSGYTASTTYTTTAIGTTAGRYLGTTSTAGSFPTSGSFVAGDFALDTTGFVYVYTGSAWSLAGTNTGLTNSWTALQTFSSGVDITGGYGLTLTDAGTGSTKLFGSNGTPFAGMSGSSTSGTWKSIATGTSGSNVIGLAVDSTNNYGILYANLNGFRKDIVISPTGMVYLAGISGDYGLNVADGTNYTSIPNTKISISGTAIAAARANTNSGGTFAITSSSTGSASSKIDFSVAASGSSGTSLNAPTTILSLDGSTNISSFGGSIVFSGISNISTTRSVSSANSGTNVSSTFTISAGNSTGTGTTSLIFQTAPFTASGSTVSNAATALTIAGTGAATFASTISATSAVFNTTGSESLLVASLSSAEKFRITNAGYVGILTSSPILPLDVSGGMRTIGPAYHAQLVVTAPTVSVVSGSSGTGTTYSYKVTAHDADTNESIAPSATSVANGALSGFVNSGNRNSIYWAAVPGALTYSLYRSTDNFATAANSVRVLQRTILYTSASPYIDGGQSTQLANTLPPLINSTSVVGIDGNVGIGTTTPSSKLDIVAQDALKITGYQPYLTLRDSNGANKGLRIQTASSEAFFALDSATAGTYVTIGKLTSNGLDILQNIFAGVASAEKTSQNGTSFGFNRYVNTASNSINTAHGYMINHAGLSTTPGLDYLKFGSYGTNGVATKENALVINGSGQIGIGIVPAADFHVTGTVAGSVAPKVFLPAQAFNLPPASYPTFLQRDANTTKYELQYSGTADQVAHTTIVVPSNYSGGNIAIKLYWYTATANQSIVWQILAKSTGNGGEPNPATDALGTIASTVNTAGMLKLETYSWNSSSGLNINTVYAGQILYLSLKRFSSNSSDTSSETINFHSMIIEF